MTIGFTGTRDINKISVERRAQLKSQIEDVWANNNFKVVHDGADFLKEDKLEDRVYETGDGIRYYYNSTYGKFESTYGTPNNNPIFYTPEDAEKYLKRVK